MGKISIIGAEIFADRREEALIGASGRETVYYASRNPLELTAELADAEGLIVNLEPVGAELLDRLPNLKVIGRYGVGFDNIDIGAATARGVAVINVPDYCIDEVAEHAVSFIFAANRKHAQAAAQTRRGVWGKVGALKPIRPIGDITLGIVGTGRIGMQVIRMMSAFGTRMLVYDPYLHNPQLPPNAAMTDLDSLLEQADIVTIHCPLNAQTRHMFNAATFAKMKRRPALVNVSRGPIVDEDALLEALDSGAVSFAALDVLETEPPSPDHPLLRHPLALVTCHIAWYSEQAETKLRDLLAVRVTDYLDGKAVLSQVNSF